MTRRWVYEKYFTWGEESPLWQARVRGEFPTDLEGALIPLAWLQPPRNARYRTVAEGCTPVLMSPDPARTTAAVIRNESGAIVAQMASAKDDSRGDVINFLAPFSAGS